MENHRSILVATSATVLLLAFGFAAPLSGADGINAEADASLSTTCDGVDDCQFDADGHHEGELIVTGQLVVEGPGLPNEGLKAVCEGTTECDTDLDGNAGFGCFVATATTETAAGGFAQDQTMSGDCGNFEM